MKCPICTDIALVMTERQGVEIDYCPTCRGVWLDRGEVDKLIERAAVPVIASAWHSLRRPSLHVPARPLPTPGRGRILKIQIVMQTAGVTAANTPGARSPG